MLTLDTWVEAHRDDGRIVVGHLLEIQRPTSGTLYYTDAATDLIWDGQTYTARAFAAPDIIDGNGDLSEASIIVDDVDGVVRVAVTTDSGDVPVEVYELWCNQYGTSQGANWLYTGYLDSITTDRRNTTLNLLPGPEPGDILVPNVRYLQTCPFAYKGIMCGYSGAEPPGETTCLKRLSDCEARSNEARFGGCWYVPESRVFSTAHGVLDLTYVTTPRDEPTSPTRRPASVNPIGGR